MAFHIFNSVLTIFSLAIAGFFVFDMIVTFFKARKDPAWPGLGFWGKARMLAWGSAVMLWSNALIIASALTSGLVWLAGAIGDPQVSALIQQYLSPNVVAALLIGASLITMAYRGRTL
jgi:hypothetical protein